MILCKVVVKSAENPYKVWRLMHIHVQESIFSLLWKGVFSIQQLFSKHSTFFSILTEMNWRFYLSKYVFIPNIAFKSSIFFSSSVHKASASLSWLSGINAGVQTTLQNSRRVSWGEKRNCSTGRKKVSITFPHCLLLYILLVKSHSKCEGLRWYFMTLFLCMTATVQHNGPLVGINLDQ